MTGDPGLPNRDRFMIKKISKTSKTDSLFFDAKHWQSLTNKRTGDFLAAKTLKRKTWWIKCHEKCFKLR